MHTYEFTTSCRQNVNNPDTSDSANDKSSPSIDLGRPQPTPDAAQTPKKAHLVYRPRMPFISRTRCIKVAHAMHRHGAADCDDSHRQINSRASPASCIRIAVCTDFARTNRIASMGRACRAMIKGNYRFRHENPSGSRV